MITHFAGMKLVVTPHATETTNVVVAINFKESKHRSARVLKKLLKRFGERVVYRRDPCIYRMRDTIFMHPAIYPQFEAQVRARGGI